MSRFLTDEQIAMRNIARQFAESDVEPRAVGIDKHDEYPEDLVKKAADLDFFGLMIPQEYGGLGAGMTTTCLVLEEIAKASPALAGFLSVQIALCPVALNVAGTEQQKQKYLPASARGEGLMALSQTEPGGVMNFGTHQTRLTRDGDAYKLNGLKIFCTQGGATVYLVGAHTSDGDQHGYGEIIVEAGMPGFEIGKYEEKLGWRGSRTGTILFNDVTIPEDNILGGLLTGVQDIGVGSLTGNLGHCASSLGCAEGLLDKTVEYIKSRDLYGKSMAESQPVSYWVGDAWVRIEACRSMLYTAARMVDEGRVDPMLIQGAKVFVCETAFEVCHRLLQIWGGSGIMTDVGVNRYFRDARTNTVAEGSSEILISAIASQVLA